MEEDKDVQEENEQKKQNEKIKKELERQKEEQQAYEEQEQQEREEQEAASLTQKAIDAYFLYKKAQKLMQLKIVASIAAALAPIGVLMMKIILILTLVVVVISILLSFIDGIYSMGDKIYNFFQYGTFEESEHVFLTTLETEYQRYHRFSLIEDDFDLPLILATVNYGRMIDPDGLNFQEYLDEYFEDNEKDLGSFLPSDRVRSFYRVMNNELGEIYTLNPAKRKLLAHLVGIKVGTRCVPTVGLNLDLFNNLEELGHATMDSLEEAGMLLANWAELDDLTVDDLPTAALNAVPAPLLQAARNAPNNIGVIFVIFYNFRSYDEGVDVNYFEAWWEGTKYSATTQNPWPFFRRIYEASIEDETTCPPGEWGIPAVVLYQDYELYRQYLVDYFLPIFYINCNSCQYRDLDEDDPYRGIIINRMADEIFMMRDLYTHFMPVQALADGTFAFPGMAAFIIDPERCIPPQTLETVLDPPCMSSPYGDRGSFWTSGGWTNAFHQGIDFWQSTGSPIFAMASGKVVRNGYGITSGYGWHVYIDHGTIDGDHYLTRYAHLARKSDLKVGEEVQGGQVIGHVGATGRATGPHLHFEIHVNGSHVDPMPYLRDIIRGESQFDVGGGGVKYLSMSDYGADYCTSERTVAQFGQLPTAYAMISSALGNETSPNEVATFICDNMPYHEDQVIDSMAASQEFGISSRTISPTINAIKSELASGRIVLANTNRGPFNSQGQNYLLITEFRNEMFLVFDPMNRTNNKGYVASSVENRILDYLVSDNIWSFSAGGGSGGEPGGTITKFNEQAWENHLRHEIERSSLLDLNPSDISQFFTGGTNNVDNWLSLFTAMSFFESRHDPDTEYRENFYDSTGQNVISTGLFQLSQESIRGYRFPGYEQVTSEQLKNPYTNISIAVQLLEHWIIQDGCIACRIQGNHRGGSRYWSVLRPGNIIDQIKTATLQTSSHSA